tara:strand:+ start:770 stop:919 length:150 start_codon:yes stop_codon:yes gene_type:complete
MIIPTSKEKKEINKVIEKIDDNVLLNFNFPFNKLLKGDKINEKMSETRM